MSQRGADEGATERAIERMRGDERDAARDSVVTEAPMEIRCRGESVVVVMRTPGHDIELATGLLVAEGAIAPAEFERVSVDDSSSLTSDERGNVLALDLEPDVLAERWPQRSLYASAACGVCGKSSIAQLEVRASAVGGDLAVAADTIAALPDKLRVQQHTFDATGGLHAAGLFTGSGELLVVREDVGRHNAVDKLVGWAAARGQLPANARMVCVSGRVSFEIVQKAVVAGVELVAAVSAPSSLAIDLAEQFRVTLCGFVRGGGFNIYSHGWRIE